MLFGLGMTGVKCFGILIGGTGEGAVIADIAGIGKAGLTADSH
jgi:hypothetical protein